MRRSRVPLAFGLILGLSCSGTPVTRIEAGVDARTGTSDAAFSDAILPWDSASALDATHFQDATLDGGSEDAGVDAAETRVDLDQDGLDDTEEAAWAESYLPHIALHSGDDCPRSAIVYRMSPHPMDPTKLWFIVDVLFERDCGAGGHVGDDEVFALTLDPTRPGPEGILAVRAISHQDTLCEHVSDCGLCPGSTTCTLAPTSRLPVIFMSRGKHGAYLSEPGCDDACFFTNFCELNPEAHRPPMINAGEPQAPLTRDLTLSGIITMDAGWSESSVFGYDPWGAQSFGGAGSVADDLTDEAFVTPVCSL